MAELKKNDDRRCTFGLAWVGPCNEPVTQGDRCDQHASLICGSCGQPATHECHETMGLVCGVPLCTDCEHELDERGTNGGWFRHCRKGQQKYTLWYTRSRHHS